MENFSLFRKLFSMEKHVELSDSIVDVERRRMEMEKELEIIKKKNSKFFKPNYRLNIQDVFPFENKKIASWTPEDIFCWLKLQNLEIHQRFMTQFVEAEYYKMGNLLRVEGASSNLLTTIRDHSIRMRFLINVLYLRHCLQKDIHFNKHMDTVFQKILARKNWKRMNIEGLLGYCEYITSFEEIKEILSQQLSDEIEILILMNNNCLLDEPLQNAIKLEVDIPPSDTGPFITGIIIGEWYLEWNESSHVAPRLITTPLRELSTVTIKHIERSFFEKVIDDIVKIIVEWNLTRKFSKRGLNSQHFVDSILEFLGVVVHDDLLSHYLTRLRDHGEQPLLPTLHVKEIPSWTSREVILWLKRIKLDLLVQKVFEEKKIDGKTLTEINLSDEDYREVFVMDPYKELAFQVHVHHIVTNVTRRGIMKYDSNFVNFADKFLKQQTVSIKGELDMNFFDLENSFFIFTTKSALMSYYLNLKPDDHIGLVILRKSEKVFRSGVMIGCMILEWKSSELIIPSRYKREDRNKSYQVDLGVTVDDTFLISSKIANLMIEYNSYFTYKEEQDRKSIRTEKNCQMFVDDVFEAFGMTDLIASLPKEAEVYFSKIRKQGKNDHVPSSQNWKISRNDEFEDF